MTIGILIFVWLRGGSVKFIKFPISEHTHNFSVCAATLFKVICFKCRVKSTRKKDMIALKKVKEHLKLIQNEFYSLHTLTINLNAEHSLNAN